MVGNTVLSRMKMCEVKYGACHSCFRLWFSRLWGDHGQSALESAHVCLINATGTGTEILKSLVLPGIGAFTIVDGKKVTEEDTGCKLVKSFVQNSELDFP